MYNLTEEASKLAAREYESGSPERATWSSSDTRHVVEVHSNNCSSRQPRNEPIFVRPADRFEFELSVTMARSPS